MKRILLLCVLLLVLCSACSSIERDAYTRIDELEVTTIVGGVPTKVYLKGYVHTSEVAGAR